jgi:hypothetical protein
MPFVSNKWIVSKKNVNGYLKFKLKHNSNYEFTLHHLELQVSFGNIIFEYFL